MGQICAYFLHFCVFVFVVFFLVQFGGSSLQQIGQICCCCSAAQSAVAGKQFARDLVKLTSKQTQNSAPKWASQKPFLQ